MKSIQMGNLLKDSNSGTDSHHTSHILDHSDKYLIKGPLSSETCICLAHITNETSDPLFIQSKKMRAYVQSWQSLITRSPSLDWYLLFHFDKSSG